MIPMHSKGRFLWRNIPDSHKKYNLLPRCSERGGEVFSYPSSENEISAKLPEGEHVIPYGYDSYEDFYQQLDCYIEQYGSTDGDLNELGSKIFKYKEDIRSMNIKENWSVLKYLGETTSTILIFSRFSMIRTLTARTINFKCMSCQVVTL